MADCSGLRERVKEEPGAKDESEGLQKQEEETPEDSDHFILCNDVYLTMFYVTTFLTDFQDGDCIKKWIVRRANLDALDKAVYLWFVQQRCKEP